MKRVLSGFSRSVFGARDVFPRRDLGANAKKGGSRSSTRGIGTADSFELDGTVFALAAVGLVAGGASRANIDGRGFSALLGSGE